ncbi:DnaD domain-containing protein [Loigolactobacillus iwatensis]|uniref:DnaD domain-containing protein n=1 Tax=Loigolactobacillus iwatensis TaxID=1267156 RepID=UPI000F7E93D2|nr:DnaD domain protein [Loigolactobacillus iwatensis]
MAEANFMHQFINAGETAISNLLLAHFHELGLTNDEFLLYLQLESFHSGGNDFPDMTVIADRLHLATSQVYQMLHRLIQKKVLEIQTSQDKSGRSQDHYDFSLLYDKLATLSLQQTQQVATAKKDDSRQKLFEAIEAEFGRPLSPIELETIGAWLDEDHYQPEVIELALREAVLNQAYSLKYMDRILLSWERKHLTTKQQIQQEKQKRTQREPNTKQSASTTNNGPQIPMYNWADPDEQSGPKE